MLSLQDLLKTKIEQHQESRFEKRLKIDEETPYHDTDMTARTVKATATQETVEIIVNGIPAINNYPIVNTSDKLFYITHEIQGKPGASYDGKIIPMEEAMPFQIDIGPGVRREEDDPTPGPAKGYFLIALKTGVVTLGRDQNDTIIGVDIIEEVEIKKLDYATGNVGSAVTCPLKASIFLEKIVFISATIFS